MCTPILSSIYPDVSGDIEDWQTAVLVDQAQRLGLLEPSTETLRTQDDIMRFVGNPSYDIGPLARMIGPLVGEFRRRQQSIMG